jgi:hypothetical protein
MHPLAKPRGAAESARSDPTNFMGQVYSLRPLK